MINVNDYKITLNGSDQRLLLEYGAMTEALIKRLRAKNNACADIEAQLQAVLDAACNYTLTRTEQLYEVYEIKKEQQPVRRGGKFVSKDAEIKALNKALDKAIGIIEDNGAGDELCLKAMSKCPFKDEENHDYSMTHSDCIKCFKATLLEEARDE